MKKEDIKEVLDLILEKLIRVEKRLDDIERNTTVLKPSKSASNCQTRYSIGE